MPYQVYWMIPDHVMYMKFTGEVSLDDLRDSTQQIADFLASAYKNAPENTIVGMVDMGDARLDSLFWSAMSIVVKQVADVVDPRLWRSKPGFTVLISNSEIAKTAISLVIKISNQPMTSVATLDEAIMTVGAMYPELMEALDAYQREHLSSDAP